MSEWLSYSLSDFLLFSPRTWHRLVELHNRAIWPTQLVTLALGVAILLLGRRGGAWRGRLIAAILAGCWLWVGWAFLLQRYATINWAATWFAAAFALQALLLAWFGIVRGALAVRFGSDAAGRVGGLILVLALAAYPLVATATGRGWMQAEAFGAMPDPTALATLGVLLAARRLRWILMPIPLAWCTISGATLWAMASPEALVAPAIAAVALLLALWKWAAARRGRAAAA